MKLSFEVIVLIIVVMLYSGIIGFCYAGYTSNLIFSWDAVTENNDNTACTDLAGYAIYRSREPDNWSNLTGTQSAFVIVAKGFTRVAVSCSEPGIWFWGIRAFDESGNFSIEISNIITTDIDTIIPGAILHFSTCQAGDINCDGDIDGADLVEFSKAFGGVNGEDMEYAGNESY